jgi:RES domain-containing protein
MWTALIGPVAELAGTFLKGKVDKQKAKSTVEIAQAEAKAEVMKNAAMHDSKWELIMAEATKNSWKDELVTIVILVPCVLAFIPGMEEVVKNGFQRLAELPEWYQYLLFLTCSAALGIRGLDKWRKK